MDWYLTLWQVFATERSRPLWNASHICIKEQSQVCRVYRTLSKVCEFYELSDDPSPSINVYPVFNAIVLTLGLKVLCKLFDYRSYEAIKSLYSYTFDLSIVKRFTLTLCLCNFPTQRSSKDCTREANQGKKWAWYGIESHMTGIIR